MFTSTPGACHGTCSVEQWKHFVSPGTRCIKKISVQLHLDITTIVSPYFSFYLFDPEHVV